MYTSIKGKNKICITLKILNDIESRKRNQIQKYAQSAYDDLIEAIEVVTKERNKDSLLDKIKVVYATKRSAYRVQSEITEILNKLKDRFKEGLIFATSNRYFCDINHNRYKQILAVVHKAFIDIIYLYKPFFC